jgi:hypothetical protein
MKSLGVVDIPRSVTPFSRVSGIFFLSPSRHFSLFSFSFETDLVGLGTIVQKSLSEPRVLERFLGRDSFLWVINKDSPQQIKKLFVEGSIRRYGLLKVVRVKGVLPEDPQKLT